MEERHDLLDFMASGLLPLCILTLESSFYLPQLRARFPNAKLYAMTSYEEVPEFPEHRNLGVQWVIGDFRKESLPWEPEFFDVVLAESCLECLWESYDTLMGISRSLKDTGHFLGSFRNIRYWRMLEHLREGRFPVRERHLYAKDEVVKMLNDAIFKEIVFAPFLQFPEESGEAEAFSSMGFDDFNGDLVTEAWMFKASRSTAAVTALKELYTKEIRRDLACLLHRIEYGVDEEKSLEGLWQLCRKELIFPEYLADFVHEVAAHEKRLRGRLGVSAERRFLGEFAEVFWGDVP